MLPLLFIRCTCQESLTGDFLPGRFLSRSSPCTTLLQSISMISHFAPPRMFQRENDAKLQQFSEPAKFSAVFFRKNALFSGFARFFGRFRRSDGLRPSVTMQCDGSVVMGCSWLVVRGGASEYWTPRLLLPTACGHRLRCNVTTPSSWVALG